MFEPKIIKLRKPLLHGDKEVSDLRFEREMVSGDLRGIPVTRLDHDHVYTMASRLCGVPVPVLAELSMPDYLEVSDYVTDFFTDSPPTGPKESPA